ncbi:MAG TPA: hypothetical protein VMT90_08620 [Dehalococcoidia bacterium]|jgi:hypothetical protein|nr:hypothetical protein [Dehalococcoidia bacterium]
MTTETKTHRFGMPATGVSQVFLIPFGVSARRAYAQVHDGKLHVRFGPMFNEQIPLANVEEAREARWPWWAGVGPRTNMRGSVALISSFGKTVKLTFKEPIRVTLFVVPVSCRTLYLSIADPEEFLKAIGKPARAAHGHAKAA